MSEHTKCKTCGADAVKTEDFVVFDAPGEKVSDRTIWLRGFIRFTLCRDCVVLGTKASIRFDFIALTVMLIMAAGAAVFGIFNFKNMQSFDIETAGQMLFAFGLTALFVFFLIPKTIIKNKKRRRKLKETFDDYPISQFVGDESYASCDYDKLTYEVLMGGCYDDGKLIKEKDYSRYFIPVNDLEAAYNRKFKTKISPEILQGYMELYRKVLAGEPLGLGTEENANG